MSFNDLEKDINNLTKALSSLPNVGDQIGNLNPEINQLNENIVSAENFAKSEVKNGPIDLTKLQEDVDSIAQSLSVLSEFAIEAKQDSGKALGVLLITLGGILYLNSSESVFEITGFVIAAAGLAFIVK